ncbi:amidohydrolase family protein [Streptomyces mirabilis]|uniref:amidohydrolase family protein n=1 Tax=Streptomyces mirabilis TaxID=68239 RepID=UPI00369F77B2
MRRGTRRGPPRPVRLLRHFPHRPRQGCRCSPRISISTPPRAAANLLPHGVARRYPNLKIILSHAGGLLPYVAHRITAALVAETGRGHEEILEDLRSFWFDTALSGGPSALPSLLAFARPDQVLFGTDWPFAPEIAVAVFTGEYDRYVGPGTGSHHAIDRNHAHALFPRLS